MSRADNSSKKCFKCGEAKPRTEFYKHGGMADGLLGKCKECTKKYVLAYRLENLEKIRAYDASRSKNPERVRLAAEINRRWRKEDRRRGAAHSKVAHAVRNGLLKPKPCSVCGSVTSLAHHESYDKPLSVVWYCQAHHKARHKQMAIEGTDP